MKKIESYNKDNGTFLVHWADFTKFDDEYEAWEEANQGTSVCFTRTLSQIHECTHGYTPALACMHAGIWKEKTKKSASGYLYTLESTHEPIEHVVRAQAFKTFINSHPDHGVPDQHCTEDVLKKADRVDATRTHPPPPPSTSKATEKKKKLKEAATPTAKRLKFSSPEDDIDALKQENALLEKRLRMACVLLDEVGQLNTYNKMLQKTNCA